MAATTTLIDGLTIPMDIIRRGIWAGTNGNNGIVKPGDLRVYALPTPGGGVFIAKGGALILSTYPTASGEETYPFVNDVAYQMDIPATPSSSGRTDYIIARVGDWNFNGSQPPSDLSSATGCTFDRVSSLSSVADPYVVLAKITIPASTATITNAMITDLRTMAVQQSEDHMISRPAVAGDTGLKLSAQGGAGEVFPNIGNSVIDIPSWATRAHVWAFWNSIRYSGGTNAMGLYWVEYGPNTATSSWKYSSQQFGFNAPNVNNDSIVSWPLMDEVPMPAAIRGTSQPFVFKARYDTSDRGVLMTGRSGVGMLVRFLGNVDTDVVAIN